MTPFPYLRPRREQRRWLEKEGPPAKLPRRTRIAAQEAAIDDLLRPRLSLSSRSEAEALRTAPPARNLETDRRSTCSGDPLNPELSRYKQAARLAAKPRGSFQATDVDGSDNDDDSANDTDNDDDTANPILLSEDSDDVRSPACIPHLARLRLAQLSPACIPH